jgi:DNA (cytosine-5)-methyltransferase 1
VVTALVDRPRTLDLRTARTVAMFAGMGGLELGLQRIGVGELVAVAEYEPPTKKAPRPTQAAARTLAHRFPGIPNLSDVSRIDWTPWVGGVDMITAGFPCQDISHAGLQLGLGPGTRSGLWSEVARAIDVLQPALVLFENVRGLRSAPANLAEEVTDDDDETGDMEPGAGPLGVPDGRDAGAVRGGAFGAVLGDLAERGYDVEWVSLRAADVGACHGRERVFGLAFADWLEELTGLPDAA